MYCTVKITSFVVDFYYMCGQCYIYGTLTTFVCVCEGEYRRSCYIYINDMFSHAEAKLSILRMEESLDTKSMFSDYFAFCKNYPKEWTLMKWNVFSLTLKLHNCVNRCLFNFSNIINDINGTYI